MIEIRIYSMEEKRACHRNGTCWIEGVDSIGVRATMFFTPETARDVADVLNDYVEKSAEEVEQCQPSTV